MLNERKQVRKTACIVHLCETTYNSPCVCIHEKKNVRKHVHLIVCSFLPWTIEFGVNLISSLYFFFFTNTIYYFHNFKIVKYLDLRKKRYVTNGVVTSFLSGIHRKELWIRPLHQKIRRSPESRIVFRRMEKRSQNVVF